MKNSNEKNYTSHMYLIKSYNKFRTMHENDDKMYS